MVFAYGVQFLGAASSPADVTLASFHPGASFSMSAWAWLTPALSLEPEEALVYSGILALLAAMAALGILRGELVSRPPPLDEAGPWAAMRFASAFYAMLAWFFIFFYHVNPEYLALLSACAMLMRPSVWFILAHTTFTGLAWLVNLAYGIDRALSSNRPRHGKAKFIDLFNQISPIDASALYDVALIACIGMSVVLAVWSILHLRSAARLQPVPGRA